jgi:hypothetical protein
MLYANIALIYPYSAFSPTIPKTQQSASEYLRTLSDLFSASQIPPNRSAFRPFLWHEWCLHVVSTTKAYYYEPQATSSRPLTGNIEFDLVPHSIPCERPCSRYPQIVENELVLPEAATPAVTGPL